MDFFLGITNKCNLNCSWCAHYRLRKLDPLYCISENEFNIWSEYTQSAGYHFKTININGLGEPTCYPDIKFLQYILIRSHKFCNTLHLLTNGINVDVLKLILPFIDEITISMWPNSKEHWKDIELFKSYHETKIHLRYNIECHDIKEHFSTSKSNKITKCGCYGPGYTMNTVFLACGTWAPSINKNGLYHTDLKEYYLDSLSSKLGTTSFRMCESCWANTGIPYKIIKHNE